MLSITVVLVFEDEWGCSHPITFTFVGASRDEIIDQADEYVMDAMELNDWALVGAEIRDIKDTRS